MKICRNTYVIPPHAMHAGDYWYVSLSIYYFIFIIYKIYTLYQYTGIYIYVIMSLHVEIH